jgi:hypothetical protein
VLKLVMTWALFMPNEKTCMLEVRCGLEFGGTSTGVEVNDQLREVQWNCFRKGHTYLRIVN